MGLPALSSMLNPSQPPSRLMNRNRLKPFWLREINSIAREIFVGAYDIDNAKRIAAIVFKTEPDHIIVKGRFEIDYDATYEHMQTSIQNAGVSGIYDTSRFQFKPSSFTEIMNCPYVEVEPKPNPFDDDSI